MILSTQTDFSAKRLGDKAAIELLAAAGFDAVDLTMFEDYNAEYLFSDEYVKYAEMLRDTAAACFVTVNQAHAPFPSYKNTDSEYNREVFKKIARCIEISGILGVKYIIVHPFRPEKNVKKANMDFYRSLEPYAAKAGVKIALENMWGWDERRGHIVSKVCSVPDEFCEFADELGTENFGVCLDIGHCGLVGEDEASFIKKLGSRLTCLHVHDTDYRKDLHTLPFMGEIDYEPICAALKEIDYKGDFTFEADSFLRRIPDGLFADALSFMEKTGRYLISRCE